MARRNVEYRVTDDNRLIIEVDLNADLGPSSTGISRLVATCGSFPVAPGLKLSLTVFKPLSKQQLVQAAKDMPGQSG